MGIDKKIFNDNFRYYYRPLCMYALHYIKDVDSAEDIVQDCFAEVWERKDDLEDVENIRAYLYTMVRNRCCHYLKENPNRKSSMTICMIWKMIPMKRNTRSARSLKLGYLLLLKVFLKDAGKRFCCRGGTD